MLGPAERNGDNRAEAAGERMWPAAPTPLAARNRLMAGTRAGWGTRSPLGARRHLARDSCRRLPSGRAGFSPSTSTGRFECEFRNCLARFFLNYLASGSLRGFARGRRWRLEPQRRSPKHVGQFQKLDDKRFSKSHANRRSHVFTYNATCKLSMKLVSKGFC